MKKILFCAAAICVNAITHGQTTITPTSTITPGGGKQKVQATPTNRNSVTPPESVTTAFNNENAGNSNVSWKVEGDNYWVSYTDPKSNLGHIIVYDKDGKVVRKENEVDNLTYPSAISDYYSKQYPKESYKVWQTERSPGHTYYFISRKGKVLWFDQTGKNVYEPEK
jgi:hypothetical protein